MCYEKSGGNKVGLVASGKKGQVTIFIIIGILILFTFAGILYFTQSTIKGELTTEGEPIISAVPKTFESIQAYTESCLDQISVQGLKILGEQGGYIYPEILGEFSSSNPTESEGINFDSIKIPYWWYNAEKDAADVVTYKSNQPKLHYDNDPEMSIEAQLSRFVNEKLDDCIGNYDAFGPLGYDISYEPNENREVIVKVGDDFVGFWLKMDVMAKKGSAEEKLNEFYVKVPLRLKHYYKTAELVTQVQQNHSILERHGMELVSIYSAKNPNKMPPTSDIGYELYAPFSWDEYDVKEKFKQALTSYVPMLRFLGSSNFYYSQFAGDGKILAQKVVDNMVIPLTGAEDLEISFDYFGWEPYFKTNSDEGVIKPEHIFVNYYILNFGTQRYETHYDISYPVMVTLNDEYALGGEGYKFVIALESNIRNNQPAEGGIVREAYPKKITSLACNSDQKNTELIKSIVVDSFTKEPVELVRLGFTIPGQDECEIGVTDQKGVVEEKYPAVYGGVVNLIHPEYLTNFYPIDTYKYKDNPLLIGYAINPDKPNQKVIEMDKFKEITVKVKKKQLKKCLTPITCSSNNWGVSKDISCKNATKVCFFSDNQTASNPLLLGEPVLSTVSNGSISKYNDYYFFNKEEELWEEEETLITLERVSGFNDQVKSDEYFASVSVKGNATTTVKLVPGIYNVGGFTTMKRVVEFPAEERCNRYSVMTWDQEKCITLNESTYTDYLTGGLEWETKNNQLIITPQDLYTANEITFYVLTEDIISIPKEIMGKKEVCTVSVCDQKDVMIPARVTEDVTTAAKASELSQLPQIRTALEPSYN
jgi:hypothetical protein